MAKFSLSQKTVRLFPLGGLVFFPHCRLPLRIFEPRYKQMTEDALAGDREIVMILPESGPSGEPVPIHSTGTLGRIHKEKRLAGGEFTLELEGLCRVQILKEIDTLKMYRQARVELLSDVMDPGQRVRRELQRTEIIRHLYAILPDQQDEAVRQYLKFLSRQCDAATFSDVVAYSSPIPLEIKQQLLAEQNVDKRLDLMVKTAHEALAGMVPDAPPVFPPEFSVG